MLLPENVRGLAQPARQQRQNQMAETRDLHGRSSQVKESGAVNVWSGGCGTSCELGGLGFVPGAKIAVGVFFDRQPIAQLAEFVLAVRRSKSECVRLR